MANTFTTVSSIDTINRGRIYFNQSAEALLTNFNSRYEPVDSNIYVDGVPELLDGVLHTSQSSATRLKLSSSKSFLSRGIAYTKVNTFSYATTLISESYLQPQELVEVANANYLYIVSDSADQLVQVGVYDDLKETVNNVLHLNGVSYSNYVRIDTDDSISSSLSISNSNFLFLDALSVRGVSNSNITVGYQAYNDNLILSSSSSEVFANNSGFINTKKAYYQFNELVSSDDILYLDCNKSNFFTLELTGNTSLIFSNSRVGAAIGILVNNYGNYYINWPSNVRWPNGRVPTLIPSGSSAVYSILPMPNQWYGVVKFGTYDY